MSQYPTPGPGGLPSAPPTQRGELAPSRAADVAIAWVLWVLLLVVCLVVSVLMAIIGLGLLYQCGTPNQASEYDVCSGARADVAQIGFVAAWIAMAVGVLGSLVMVIAATAGRRRAWIWPTLGFGLVVLTFVTWRIAAVAVS